MNTVANIQLAWKLYNSKVSVDTISQSLETHRSTIFRWIHGIKAYGIREFVRRYQKAKTRTRTKRIDLRIEPLIVEYRRTKTNCGQKIREWLRRTHGLLVSVATIYRILAKHFILRSQYIKWTRRPPVPRAKNPRDVIQIDNIDLGELFAHNFIDTFTREVVSIVVTDHLAQTATAALEQAMDYFRSSLWIQTDNGTEYQKSFRHQAKKYCQHLRQITPYQKEENGFVESFNRTLRSECVGWRKYQKGEKYKLQQRINDYLKEYHTQRYHLSLNLMTPHEFIQTLKAKSRI